MYLPPPRPPGPTRDQPGAMIHPGRPIEGYPIWRCLRLASKAALFGGAGRGAVRLCRPRRLSRGATFPVITEKASSAYSVITESRGLPRTGVLGGGRGGRGGTGSTKPDTLQDVQGQNFTGKDSGVLGYRGKDGEGRDAGVLDQMAGPYEFLIRSYST